MARFTIKSRIHGDVSFFVPDSGGYVRMEGEGANHGTLGQQICYGGEFRGCTLTATPETLEKVARTWWRQRLAAERKEQRNLLSSWDY